MEFKTLLYLGSGPISPPKMKTIQGRGTLVGPIPIEQAEMLLTDSALSHLFLELDATSLQAYKDGQLVVTEDGRLEAPVASAEPDSVEKSTDNWDYSYPSFLGDEAGGPENSDEETDE